MGHYVKIFAVHENDKEVFRGTAIEIEKWNEMITRDKVYTYIRNQRKLFGCYSIHEVESRWVTDKKDPPKERKKQTKHEYNLEWIRIALNKPPYYMTSFRGKGDEFVDELKAEGITFRAEKHPKDKGCYYLIRT